MLVLPHRRPLRPSLVACAVSLSSSSMRLENTSAWALVPIAGEVAALAQQVRKLPSELRRSLTWDRGKEMANQRASRLPPT
jgi:hypothetical protein